MRRIALLGSAPSSVTRAPYDDPSWEIWGCSPGAIPHMKRITRFFEMHRWLPENPCCEINYVKRLSALAVPVYMIHPQPEIPGAVRYPKEQILDFVYGTVKDAHGHERPVSFNPNDFGSTLSWMLAMAIMELAGEPGQNEIGLWGVDMAAGEEFGPQKDGCLSLLHIAKSIGIRIVLPPESDLIRPCPLYGYNSHDHFYIKLDERRKETEGRLNDARRRMQAALEETRFLEGALDVIKYDQNTWVGDGQALRIMYSQPAAVIDAVSVAPDGQDRQVAVLTPDPETTKAIDAVAAGLTPAHGKAPAKARKRALNPGDKRLKANRAPKASTGALPNGKWADPKPMELAAQELTA